MTKKLTALLAAVVLLLTLGGCGKKAENPPAIDPTEATRLAETFVKAYYLRDYAARFPLCFYDARARWEDAAIRDAGSAEEFFQLAQRQADEKGIEVTVDSFDSYYSAYRQFILEDVQEIYGDYTLTTTATDSVKMGEDQLSQFRHNLLTGPAKEYIDADALNAVTEVYTVTVHIHIEGEKKNYDENYVVYVVNHNGQWLVADHSN